MFSRARQRLSHTNRCDLIIAIKKLLRMILLTQLVGCGRHIDTEEMGPPCTVNAENFRYHTWSKITSAPSTFTAFTILTIVNPDSGTSRVTTIMNEPPAGYTPPPINGKGTKLSSVTYTSHGNVLTTTVQVPQSFVCPSRILQVKHGANR